jgi:uncharacterized protein YecE (DUF72 family)
MQLWVGTSGYSYKQWKGSFYPEGLAEKNMLRFYGEHFSTVEINNSFYRMPSSSVLARWSEEVPKEFAFVLKAPRRITHEKRLADAGDDVSFLFDTASVLGAKLGPILFQLPPFSKRDLPRLENFLNAIPVGARVALEFRHASWFADEVYDALRSRGASLCLAETDEEGETPLIPTTSWGYLRLRRQDYDDSDLKRWAKKVQQQSWNETFVFFKHEDEGKGPKLAKRFVELCGIDRKSE